MVTKTRYRTTFVRVVNDVLFVRNKSLRVGCDAVSMVGLFFMTIAYARVGLNTGCECVCVDNMYKFFIQGSLASV